MRRGMNLSLGKGGEGSKENRHYIRYKSGVMNQAPLILPPDFILNFHHPHPQTPSFPQQSLSLKLKISELSATLTTQKQNLNKLKSLTHQIVCSQRKEEADILQEIEQLERQYNQQRGIDSELIHHDLSPESLLNLEQRLDNMMDI